MFDHVECLDVTFDKTSKAMTPSAEVFNWRETSIFFELPCWKMHLVGHNVYVMHAESNVCDLLLETIKGITKDTLNACYELIPTKIRKELHPISEGGNRFEATSSMLIIDDKREISLS